MSRPIKPPAEPVQSRLVTRAAAAQYFGVSVRHFETIIRPHIPCVDLAGPTAGRPMPRWDVADLEAFLVRRKREPAA